MGSVSAVLGIGVHRAGFRGTAACLTGLLVALVVPAWSHEVYTLAILLSFILVSRGLKPGRGTMLSNLLDGH